jgi:alkylated DNA repair dioxygenase AlkB
MPEGLLYRPDFLSPQEEQDLLAAIRRLPLDEAKNKGFTARRRTASFGPAPEIPAFLLCLRDRAADLVELRPEAFRHALITEYRPGTELGWHRDVPEFEIVVGVSLAGMCRMRFRRYPPEKGAKAFKLDLEPRSVYVLRDEIRWRWQHSVAPTLELRYSVTFRTRR